MGKVDLDKYSPKEYIIIKGAKLHNLKDVDVVIPKNKLVVVTGLSGSGKSSLAFNTLYAEGQRRYVESLSAYARQFLGRIDKPDVDYIKGVAPAIAIEQRESSKNTRSTVATTTEIYDYLRLLFARVGDTLSPISGELVTKDAPQDIVNDLLADHMGSRCLIAAKVDVSDIKQDPLERLRMSGFTRIVLNGEPKKLDEVTLNDIGLHDFDVVIDRLKLDQVDDLRARLSEAVELAYYEGKGECVVYVDSGDGLHRSTFSNKFEKDGILFEEPTLHFFSFNNPLGACQTCEGFGSVIGLDPNLVIPNKTLSIYDDAIVCWKGDKMREWKDQLVLNSHKFDFPIHQPYTELTNDQVSLLWTGNEHFQGLNEFFAFVESNSYKIQYRVMLSRYRGRTLCQDCHGTRLRKEVSYVKVGGKSLVDVLLMGVTDALNFFKTLELSPQKTAIASRILIEIKNRLSFLDDVGVGYLLLNRSSATLSGGEVQRIKLASSLGSSLVGSMYILDEPSIGLHGRDTSRLITVLQRLRDIGNTVVVVEHDEDIMKAADHIIDLGPEAGSNGGELIFSGNYDELIANSHGLTAKYLRGEMDVEAVGIRPNDRGAITIRGARENNLNNVDVDIPLEQLVVVTGVSGSGKSSLIKGIFHPGLQKHLSGQTDAIGEFDGLQGDLNNISGVEFVDQNPIGRSSRSNPVTYVKAYDDIRALFANHELAKVRGFKPAHFSFNVEGGRCEACQGEGVLKVEMQFMADVTLTCEDCNGRRFRDEVLEVKFHDKSISDVLEMTVDDALIFFKSTENQTAAMRKLLQKLEPLHAVGLGYVKMGQSSSTLSGGEAQRIKLASFLGKTAIAKAKSDNKPLMFIFDEPTTGLHFHDVTKLMAAFYALLEQGHSLVVIEHHPDVIKCADWIIDLGPDGGVGGGNIVFEGTPAELAGTSGNFTAQQLANKIAVTV